MRFTAVFAGLAVAAGAATVQAHIIKGLNYPLLATAFVSSPTTGTDAPLPVRWGTNDTGLRVACFYVANTSPARADAPQWPRVVGAGFELPGQLSGFTLVQPLETGWALEENVRATLNGQPVKLDFAIVASHQRGREHEPVGIPPGQPPARGNGTRFCVAGPFPDELVPGQPTTIEQLLNGVVVSFKGIDAPGRRDLGLWDNPARFVPFYPE